MYEAPYLRIIFLDEQDVICASNNWHDENVDDDGWT